MRGLNRRSRPSMTTAFLGLVVLIFLVWQVLTSFSNNNNGRTSISIEVAQLKELSSQNFNQALDWDALTHRYGYNVIKSRSLPLDRSLPDVRPPSCTSLSTEAKLPTTSIVVTFSNGDQSLLLRNVVSILRNSQRMRLEEIILVVDIASEDNALFDWERLSKLPQTKIIRNKELKGRSAARVQGADAASGEVLVFVDGTTEVNVDWLYPLVSRIVEHPKSMVSPTLDVMHHVTFDYRSLPGVFRGGFYWSLEFHLEDVPYSFNVPPDPTIPIKSPVIPGSVFAIRKDYFDWLGRYSKSQNSSDVDDLELSLKVWMCGGQVEIDPCSRVGVLQVQGREIGARTNSYQHYLKSARRVAEVWLDEYKRFFYAVRPSARMQQNLDVRSERNLRSRLKCKNFKWYLSSVYPQLQPLISDEFAYGRLKQGTMCVDLDPGQLPLIAKLRPCDDYKDSQEWSWRKKGLILSSGMCLTSDTGNLQGYVVAEFCKDGENQFWFRHNEKIVHQSTGLCLDGHQGNKGLMVTECVKLLDSQVWHISKGDTVNAGNTRDSELKPKVLDPSL